MFDFEDKHPLSKKIFWSATFESWNQRSNDLYYSITIFKKKGKKYILQDNFTIQTYGTDDSVKENEALFERLAILVKIHQK